MKIAKKMTTKLKRIYRPLATSKNFYFQENISSKIPCTCVQFKLMYQGILASILKSSGFQLVPTMMLSVLLAN